MHKLAVMLISVTLFAATVTQGAAAPLRNHNRNADQQSNTGHAESPADGSAQPRCVGSCAPYGGMQGDRNPESPPYPHVPQR
jgi:hypothetical protein